MRLPIELVPNTSPPRFRWINELHGVKVELLNTVAPNLEVALSRLCQLAESQADEIFVLKNRLEGASEVIASQGDEIKKLKALNQQYCDRIAAQSESLSKQAENKELLNRTNLPAPPTQQQPQTKKGK